MAQFVLSPVKSRAEFESVVEAEYAAYSSPPNPLFETWWMQHLFQSDPDPYASALRELSDRQWAWHEHDPTSTWIKVTDRSTGKVVGAAQWHVHTENPFAKPAEPLVATWWPEGDGRNYATEYLKRMLDLRPSTMNKPHTLLGVMFVHPEWRRRGVGSLLMNWGIQETDALNLPSFVEASADGEHLYAAYGYQSLHKLDFDLAVPNPSEEWKRLYEKYPPMYGVVMYRPAAGKPIENGKSA